MLDVHNTRAHFPALQSDWALLDNAGGTVPARQVVARVADYMSRCPVQHGASYPLALEAAARVAEGRADKLAVRWGHFYTRRAMEPLGLDPEQGLVRVGLAHYNTADEVARLIKALGHVLGVARRA